MAPSESSLSIIDQDLRDIYISRLNEMGYSVDPSETVEQVGYQYFNVLKRRIPSQPRTVRYSNELQTRLISLPPDQQEGVRALERKAAAGQDLYPNQSELIEDAEFSDLALMDWQLHHFHLSQEMQPNGFVRRGGPLLFAVEHPSKIFFADVRDHRAFAQQELIEIVNRNWPQITQGRKLNGIKETSQFSDEDRARLRKRGVNILPGLADGTTHAGSMMAGDGKDMTVRMQEMRLRKEIHLRIEVLEKDKESQLKQIRAAGYEITDVSFRLKERNSRIVFVEENSGVALGNGWLDLGI